MEYDELLTDYIGEFGLYQKIIYFLLCLLIIPTSFNMMSPVFLVSVSDHWCDTPSLDPLNLTLEDRLNLSVPIVEYVDNTPVYSSCELYDRNYSSWHLTYNGYLDTESQLQSNTTVSCPDGWIYDRSVYESTATTEFSIVCEMKWLQATSTAIYMVGTMIGVTLFSAVADLFGRKVTICVSIVTTLVTSVAIAFVPSFTLFVVLRFLLAMVSAALYTSSFVMAVELVGPNWRVHAGIILIYFWSLGYIILAGIAYLIRDWRKLQLAISVPSVLLLIYFFILPESVRWLYAKGKKEKADKEVSRIVKWNKSKLPEKLDISFKKTKDIYMWDVFKMSRLRILTLVLMYNWFVNSLVYYGLSLNINLFGGNPYLNFFLAGAVEIPSNIFLQVCVIYFGRRVSLVGLMGLAGLTLILTLAVPQDLQILTVVLATIGKFGISSSFSLIYVYTSEVYPTKLRTSCVGLCSLAARIGGVVAPYIGLLSDFEESIPIIIFGVTCLLAAALTFGFPETRGIQLPETLEEAEEFSRLNFKWCLKKNPKESEINDDTRDKNLNDNAYIIQTRL